MESTTYNNKTAEILPYTTGLTGVNLHVNDITTWVLWGTIGFILLLVLSVRLVRASHAYIRLLTTLNSSRRDQRYWTYDGGIWARVRKHFVSAPLIHKRHHREFQLSIAHNVGTLPGRPHTLFLALYVISQIVFCLLLDYRTKPHAAILAEIRGRSGHLAVINMVFLFLFATRNNPLISILGIPFDTFNLFHRWIGRIIILESIVHVFIWGVNKYDALGMDGIAFALRTDRFVQYGLISAICMVLLLLQSPSAIRHAFYETFLHVHQFLACVAFIGILLHALNQSLPQLPWIILIMSIWILERCTRIGRILWYNVSRREGITKVHVTALEGGACRVTFNIKKGFTKSPGTHIYAYIPAVSFWMSHPFSVAWVSTPSLDDDLATLVDSKDSNLFEMLPLPTNSHRGTKKAATFLGLDVEKGFDKYATPRFARAANAALYSSSSSRAHAQVSCVLAQRTGMTRTLYNLANASPTKSITLRGAIEGPYGAGAAQDLRSYGTVVLFAGGVGITCILSYLRCIVDEHRARTSSTRKVVLVWSVRSAAMLEWVRPWLEQLLLEHARCEESGSGEDGMGLEIKVLLYVTQKVSEHSAKTEDWYGGVVHFGRPNIAELVNKEFEERVGAVSVGVCGPGGLADDVRCVTRGVICKGRVDFWEEGFTW